MPQKDEKGNIRFVCRKCGTVTRTKDLKIKEVKKNKEKIHFIDKKENELPTIKEKCPKCGNSTAYYWMIQTRAADEPPTKFYRCTKCSYTWRDYS